MGVSSDTIGTILLATDGSPHAAEAARAAVALAQGAGARLHVLHAWHYAAYAGLELSGGSSSLLYAGDEQLAREVLAAAVAALETAGGTLAGQHLRRDRPASAIVALAAELGADLIVLGSRGLGPLRRLVLGSVADEVAHTAPCPTLVMRGGADAWPPTRIVIGDDGSPAAGRAAALAATIGGLCGAPGILVRTYPPPPNGLRVTDSLLAPILPDTDRADVPTAQELHDEAIGRAERDLAARAAALAPLFGAVPDVLVLTDTPAAALLGVAGEGGPALIAVGSRGLGPFRRFRLGSVSSAVLHAADGPVLVVPPRPAGAAIDEHPTGTAATPARLAGVAAGPPTTAGETPNPEREHGREGGAMPTRTPGSGASFGTILVPLDGSALAERALSVAETFARQTGGRLVLVRAVPYLSRPAGDAPFPTLAAARAAAAAEAQGYLDGLVAGLATRGLAATATVPEEDEAAGIVAAARRAGADLIALATHGRSGLGRWVYGSIAEQVLADAPIPVLLVRAWGAAVPEVALGAGAPILVPLDGSALAEAALSVAEGLAEALGSPLLLLRVVSRPGLDFRPDTLVAPQLAAEWAERELDARAYLAGLASRLGGREREVLTEVRVGAPIEAIEATGREHGAGVVVMATHGLTGLRRTVLGSVADGVVRQGSLPVLLVRSPEGDDGSAGVPVVEGADAGGGSPD